MRYSILTLKKGPRKRFTLVELRMQRHVRKTPEEAPKTQLGGQPTRHEFSERKRDSTPERGFSRKRRLRSDRNLWVICDLAGNKSSQVC